MENLFLVIISLLIGVFVLYFVLSLILREVAEFLFKIEQHGFHQSNMVSFVMLGMILLQFAFNRIAPFDMFYSFVYYFVFVYVLYYIIKREYQLSVQKALLMAAVVFFCFLVFLALVAFLVYVL